VIVDALSEREPATQQHVEEMFAGAAVYNSVVITSRTEPLLRAVERTRIYPLLLDQKQIVPFIVDYVAQLENGEPLQGGRTLLQLGDRILELAEAGGRATPVTPLLVTLFVSGALSRAQVGLNLDSLPQDVPEIFVGYLRRVLADPMAEVRGTAEDEFIRAARVVARASLGARIVPGDVATTALETADLRARTTDLLDALTSGGVIEHRTLGGISILRFALDPVAEYLTAIQAVTDLRQLGRAEILLRITGLSGQRDIRKHATDISGRFLLVIARIAQHCGCQMRRSPGKVRTSPRYSRRKIPELRELTSPALMGMERVSSIRGASAGGRGFNLRCIRSANAVSRRRGNH